MDFSQSSGRVVLRLLILHESRTGGVNSAGSGGMKKCISSKDQSLHQLQHRRHGQCSSAEVYTSCNADGAGSVNLSEPIPAATWTVQTIRVRRPQAKYVFHGVVSSNQHEYVSLVVITGREQALP